MTTMLVSTFKAKCAEVLNNVSETGETVIVTRRGKPLAQVVPMKQKASEKRVLAATPGELIARGDIVSADGAADWEALS